MHASPPLSPHPCTIGTPPRKNGSGILKRPTVAIPTGAVVEARVIILGAPYHYYYYYLGARRRRNGGGPGGRVRSQARRHLPLPPRGGRW
jgi:hypothetical protein